MPGYEPFLLCDFHVHTRWSDGRLSLRDTIDLYGRTGKFDVIIALDIKRYISADQSPDDILKEIRRQGALSVACHPHHRAVRRLEISTCYLWDHRSALAGLVDVWKAANRDDLFSVTSLKHFPYVASSDFHKPKHLYSWKTLLRAEKDWPAIRKALCANVDVALTLFRKDSWSPDDSAWTGALRPAALGRLRLRPAAR